MVAEANETGSDPPSWIWALPLAYTAHIVDEFFVGLGFYNWVGEFVEFSAKSFLSVNFMIISLVAVASAVAIRSKSGAFLAVAVFTQFTLHGLVVHPAFSLGRGELSPGFSTGLAILLPMSFLGFRWAAGSLAPRRLFGGIAAGFLLFASQDLWRILFNRLFTTAA